MADCPRSVVTQSLKRISCCALNMLNIWLGFIFRCGHRNVRPSKRGDLSLGVPKGDSEFRSASQTDLALIVRRLGLCLSVCLGLIANCSLGGRCNYQVTG